MSLKGKFYIIPYTAGSESVGLLCDKLDILAVRTDGKSKVLNNPAKKLFMYWGKPNSQVNAQMQTAFYKNRFHPATINNSSNIQYAVDKRSFFDMIRGQDYCLPYTTDQGEALAWVVEDEAKVIARSITTGMGGEGIKVIRSADDWKDMEDYKFFTKYVPKKAEYRVHVFDGKVIHVSRKVMPNGKKPEGDNWEVRSHDNGFIFQREEQDNVPAKVLDSAIHAVKSCGLLFAGADVIWNEKQKKAYVCELNSAPGIEGATVDAYAEAIQTYLKTIYTVS